ncbi:2-C-methyl-D-erythritol 4-phosphate cytidylyltransferase [Williamsia sp. Leaf354]|uniref:2-C-methyl-D-erythritol 4-phosphate cytidylyltransferase n=1 Tax=Williamsia sp. Leaf354 TaxID=1736349 RepID=UPI0006FCE88A|nr:2-C-methyl-D-erythritol 4-phosphate cytidylyltransferase [Williamsia sp. Leaf354]KQR96346.1 2-C-methyl-D-erythritol 4-phosphate cytidylyltransferase [Williamsia sp. Leaf354]
MTTVALIPAAGSGTRLGAGMPKAFVDLGGRTILERSVDGVFAAGVDEVVVAVPAALLDTTRSMLPRVHVVVGGSVRSDSVRACLAEVGPSASDVVLIHDAARALTPPEVFTRVIDAVTQGSDVVVPAVPVTDTLKRVDPQQSGAAETVVATVDRTPLRAVQTPQGFRPEALRRAHAAAGDATDDAGLAEAAGYAVHVVPGDLMAFKITTAWDLRIARMLLESTGVR